MFKFPFQWRTILSREKAPPRRSRRNRETSEASDARALAGAIALGLVFALALTIAASWAPESIAQRALERPAELNHPLGS